MKPTQQPHEFTKSKLKNGLIMSSCIYCPFFFVSKPELVSTMVHIHLSLCRIRKELGI